VSEWSAALLGQAYEWYNRADRAVARSKRRTCTRLRVDATVEDAPGSKDRTLDIQIVRETIRTQFPRLAAEEVRPLGEGWDFEAFEVDESLVFRFPKRQEYDAHLLKEIALLDDIGPRLPIPVPRYKYLGRPSADFPYHFGGYTKLQGVPALGIPTSSPVLAAEAVRLGEFLARLHALDPKDAARIAIHVSGEEDAPAGRRKGALSDLGYLEGKMDPRLHELCWRFFEDEVHTPMPYQGPARLLHNDLLSEHILVAPDSGHVTGIIDWSDATVGDPACDFAGLWVWQGDEFVSLAVDAYGQRVDTGFLQRARYNGLVVAVGNLYYGHVKGEQVYVEDGLACLRRFFKQ
jgi:aminoglycoside phosphotransferase (APT) family kinase protein